MLRAIRSCASALLLLTLSGTTAVSVAVGDAGACAMCARHCCCKPTDGGKACRLSRPCAGSERDNVVPAGQIFKGILDGSTPSLARPDVAYPLRVDATSLPAGVDPSPPVPPPRTSRG